tara:strand:+ start:440 stop:616 length:177 start_codon:yes stop_codon:yes gene_type:complete
MKDLLILIYLSSVLVSCFGGGGFDRSKCMNHYMHEEGYSYDEADEVCSDLEGLMWEPH